MIFPRTRSEKVRISNQKELRKALQAAWNDISPTVTQNLVDSMPRRLKAVIAAKGMHTKY